MAKKLRARRRMQRYYERLALGLCPECGARRDIEGLQCSKCRAQNNLARTRIPKAKKSRYQLNYYRRNRKRGLCPSCGKVPDDLKHIYCSVCRARVMRRYRQDPVEAKYRRIINGWDKRPPPVPLCLVCQLHHRRCGICGKYMHGIHGEKSCTWTCRCGMDYEVCFIGGRNNVREETAISRCDVSMGQSAEPGT